MRHTFMRQGQLVEDQVVQLEKLYPAGVPGRILLVDILKFGRIGLAVLYGLVLYLFLVWFDLERSTSNQIRKYSK